ncbi:hypothetical protein ACFQ3Z_39055 [Streptomyces nogalater]
MPVLLSAPLCRITPNRVTPEAPPDRHLLRTGAPLPRPILCVHQDGRLLHRARLGPGTALPHRP